MMRRSLGSDKRGAVLVEFAFVAPVMILMMMGLGDLLYLTYARALLNGAVQKAARDGTIQGAAQQTATLDSRVMTVVGSLIGKTTQSCGTNPPAATYCPTRVSYSTFAQAGPEPFSDDNRDGVRQPTECYADINGNGTWDANPGPGTSGQGGANDVTLYTMTVTYSRIFPMASLLGWPSTQTITASTLLKNQPYQTQSATPTIPATICQ